MLPSLALSRLGAIRSNSVNRLFKQGMRTQLAIEGTSGCGWIKGRAELYCAVHPPRVGSNVGSEIHCGDPQRSFGPFSCANAPKNRQVCQILEIPRKRATV